VPLRQHVMLPEQYYSERHIVNGLVLRSMWSWTLGCDEDETHNANRSIQYVANSLEYAR